jgi:hypothetical protein
VAEIYFDELRLIVIRHTREIEALEPEYQSTEWYLLKYLNRITKNTLPPTTTGRMENCMRGFIRFYVDNIDEQSLLGERCRNIYDAYKKTLRTTREET